MTQEIRSIAGLNSLPRDDRYEALRLLIPAALLARFQINASNFTDEQGNSLLKWDGEPGQSDAQISLFHQHGAQDPLTYFHLTDTVSQQIHVLLAVVNDPASARFDVDQLPDGSRTHFGIFKRNIAVEVAAFNAGLAPGQVRRGLRVLRDLMEAFEAFMSRLGHSLYFIEPLQYHNAIVFERYGFAYQQGRRWMQSLNTRFSAGGDLVSRFDGSTPFRQPEAAGAIRGRSWAIHDGILGEPYTGVTMYKRVGQQAGINTFPNGVW